MRARAGTPEHVAGSPEPLIPSVEPLIPSVEPLTPSVESLEPLIDLLGPIKEAPGLFAGTVRPLVVPIKLLAGPKNLIAEKVAPVSVVRPVAFQ